MFEKEKKNEYGAPLSTGRIIGYNMGKAMEIMMIGTIGNVVLPFYSINLGINPGWIGVVIIFPRLLDAITDVFMGWISDNTKTRWGRRRPWMLLGGLLAGVFFFLIWAPPVHWEKVSILIYFLIINSLFYLTTTIFLVPYYALGNELTMDPDERVRVMGIRSAIWGVATIVTPWAYRLFYCPIFGATEIEGARTVGALIGFVCILFGMISVASSRENPDVMNQAYIPIKSAVLGACRSRPFRLMIPIAALAMFGFGMVSGFNMFVGTYYVFNGDQAAMAHLWGYVGMVWGIAAFVVSAFMPKIIRRFGGKRTVFVSLASLIIGSISSWWAYNPAHPMLAIITSIFVAPGVIGVQTVSFVWLADICDFDEFNSGKRREGVFSAVQSFVNKSCFAMAGGVAGMLAAAAGVNTSLAQQSSETIFNIRFIFAVVPVSMALVAGIFTILYPLTEDKMKEVRAALLSRHSKAV